MRPLERLKKWIYNLIRDDDENDLASDIIDGSIITLVIVNTLIIIAQTFSLPSRINRIFNIIEVVSVAIFTIEYVLRVWTSDLMRPSLPRWKARIRYVFSFMALIDLFAILPFYLPFVIRLDLRVLRMLRIIRLFRLFKVERYSSALDAIGEVLHRKKSQLLSSIFVVVLLMVMSAVIMYEVEHDAQPEAFENAFSSLWWAVATLTTVGYGDVYPVTVLGKILSATIALLGIGLVAIPTGIISAGFTEIISENKDSKKDQNISKSSTPVEYCPYCGHKYPYIAEK